MPGPLSDVVVVELAGIGPAPFAGMMLADMGADVIRIDRLPTGSHASRSPAGDVVGRGRRSISIDLKAPRGVETALRLVEHADVLIEGYRPGVAEALGLGPETCRARNPGLVYGRMTGWGQDGPLSRVAGHDLNYIALTGALHAIGPSDRPPPPPLNLVGDYGGGGMLLALGVIAALFEKQRSGLGQVVDAAMIDGVAVLMSAIYGLHGKDAWEDRREANLLDGAAPFYGCYECADGRYVSIAAIEPQFYRLLLDRCGIVDPAFDDQWDRRNWPEMRERLATMFRSRDRDAWCALLGGTDACFAPVLSMSEAPEHPHCRDRSVFVRRDGMVQPAPAPRFERTPSRLSAAAPAIGRDTAAILQALRYSDAEISRLVEEKIVHRHDDETV